MGSEMTTTGGSEFDDAGFRAALARAQVAIAETEDIGAARDLLAQADALRAAVRSVGESQEMQNAAAELKLRAARRVGEFLLTMREEARSGPGPQERYAVPEGLTKDMAARFRKLARVEGAKFENYIAMGHRLGAEITLNGVLRFAPRVPGSRGFSHSEEAREKAMHLRGEQWTQAQIAEFLSVSPSTVAYWLDVNYRRDMLDRKKKSRDARKDKAMRRRAAALRKAGDPLGEVEPLLRRAAEQLQAAVDSSEGAEQDRRQSLFPLVYGLEDALRKVMQGSRVRAKGSQR